MTDNNLPLSSLGERDIVSQFQGILSVPKWLKGGVGHDCAALDITLSEDDVLLVNTDRTGFNVAYQYGLLGPECIGDLAVTHSISDIYAAGGQPFAVTIALLLPRDTTAKFVLTIMEGANTAAQKYGAYVVGGDTKHSTKGCLVVTALGQAKKKEHLMRSGARSGDLIVTTGELGDYLVGTLVYQKRWEVPPELLSQVRGALMLQQPPFELARELAQKHIPSACTDISDGLLVAVSEIARHSELGALLTESQLPVSKELASVATNHGLHNMHLTLTGGDWQYLYAIPIEKYTEASEIAEKHGRKLMMVGQFDSEVGIRMRLENGEIRKLKVEGHDSFANNMSGKTFYDAIADHEVNLDFLE